MALNTSSCNHLTPLHFKGFDDISWLLNVSFNTSGSDYLSHYSVAFITNFHCWSHFNMSTTIITSVYMHWPPSTNNPAVIGVTPQMHFGTSCHNHMNPLLPSVQTIHFPAFHKTGRVLGPSAENTGILFLLLQCRMSNCRIIMEKWAKTRWPQCTQKPRISASARSISLLLSLKWEKTCPTCSRTTVQNFTPLGKAPAEKSITVHTAKKKKGTVNLASRPILWMARW